MLRLLFLCALPWLIGAVLVTVAYADTAPRWEASALEQLSFDATGGCVSYHVADLGTTGFGLWADAGALAWNQQDRTEAFAGVSTNMPWLGKEFGDRARWGYGIMAPSWETFAYVRAVVISW